MSAPPADHQPAWVEREAYLMGTTLRVAIESADRGAAIGLIERVFDETRRLDAVLSTWRDDSEIAALNHAVPGRPVQLSAELAGLLREAAVWSRATDGAFDPGIGPLMDAYDLRGAGRLPTAAERRRAVAATGLGRFALAADGSAARPDSIAWLDTGGFGKGAALRSAGRLLRAAGVRHAMLNFGGQVLAIGGDATGHPWPVPVAHPARRQEPAAHLLVRDRSVSTSAQSERGVTVNGARLGHIVDPRSGEPVAAWGSVTVVAEDALVADILSTALLVLGPEAALRWADQRSDVGVLLLIVREEQVRPRYNRAMARYLVSDSTFSTRSG
ncbi:MAG TPA: FAD:protein FMN transferase [Gemmatimonadales bacterium]|nr:FAD:protein FMN transferase [Gemmatimonadales bacterium]